MARQSFLVPPFVDVDSFDLGVSVFTGPGGDPSVVFQLGHGMTMHVYDRALLMRLAEVVAQGRDLLDAELSGQDPLPVCHDDRLVGTQALGLA